MSEALRFLAESFGDVLEPLEMVFRRAERKFDESFRECGVCTMRFNGRTSHFGSCASYHPVLSGF